ncbi:hypothetical protein [Nannocystis pusilla]|uniref:hypothetical protein n=1 Tax=Nannocystis pusilla TaxID=889268 RepID=UPI003DA37EDB
MSRPCTLAATAPHAACGAVALWFGCIAAGLTPMSPPILRQAEVTSASHFADNRCRSLAACTKAPTLALSSALAVYLTPSASPPLVSAGQAIAPATLAMLVVV